MDIFFVRLFLLLILLFLSAFFSSSETAFFSLGRLQLGRMKEERSRQADLVLSQIERPKRLLITILVGNIVVNVFASSLAAGILISLFGDKGILMATILMTFLILIFGEIAPKSLALQNAESLSKKAALPISLLSKIIFPVREALGALTGLVVPGQRASSITEDELRTMVKIGHQEGVVDRFEKKRIDNILRLNRMTAKEIMTPRTELFSLDEQTPLPEARVQIKNSGYSRIPIYRDSNENIVGIVYAKELLASQVSAEGGKLADFVRAVDFVPETKRLSSLLLEFRRQRRHLFVVIDEYGSLAGVVTLEDVLEEIVGRIADRRDLEKSRYKFLDNDTIRVSARMEIEHFNEIFGTTVESGEFETVGGFLIDKIGRIPKRRESFRIGQLDIRVTKATKNRVVELEIRKVK